MNSKPEKTGRPTRSGRIVGTLVIATCLFLGGVWLLGNFLIARYPGAATNIASVKSTSFDSSSDEDASDEDASGNSAGASHSGIATAEIDGTNQNVTLETVRANRAIRTTEPQNSGVADHAKTEIADDSTSSGGGLQSSLDTMESESGSRWDDVALTDTSTRSSSNTDSDSLDSGWESTESDSDIETDSFEDPLDMSFDNPVALNTTEAGDLDHTFEPSDPPKLNEIQAKKPLDVVVDTGAPTPLVAEGPNPTSSATGELGSRNRAVLRSGATSSLIADTTSPRKALKPLRAATPVGKTYPVRTWTSSDKRQVDAHFVSSDEKSVILSVRGKLYRVPLTRLSKKDLNYLETIQDPALSK